MVSGGSAHRGIWEGAVVVSSSGERSLVALYFWDKQVFGFNRDICYGDSAKAVAGMDSLLREFIVHLNRILRGQKISKPHRWSGLGGCGHGRRGVGAEDSW